MLLSKKPTILVIEDEIPLLELLKEQLTGEGFVVVTAKSAKQALDYLEHGLTVDLIWLDHYLFANERGTNLVLLLKSIKAWKHIPIFVVSNSGNPERKREYEDLGVTRYFVKAETRLDTIIAELKKILILETISETYNNR